MDVFIPADIKPSSIYYFFGKKTVSKNLLDKIPPNSISHGIAWKAHGLLQRSIASQTRHTTYVFLIHENTICDFEQCVVGISKHGCMYYTYGTPQRKSGSMYIYIYIYLIMIKYAHAIFIYIYICIFIYNYIYTFVGECW